MSTIKMKKPYEFIIRYIAPPPGKPAVLTAGLPGLGLVGTGGASFLLSRSKSAPFKVASVVSTDALSMVFAEDGGLAQVSDFSIEYVDPMASGLGALVLIGRAQPPSTISQFALAETVLKIAKEFNVSWVLTMGGYQVPLLSPERHVYIAANDLTTYKIGIELDMRQLSGQVTGAAGVIAGLSKYMGFHGGCILAETDGKPPDLKASEAVYTGFIKLLTKIEKIVPL